jgi:archaellum biogenesis ATPase FlaH
MTIRHPEVDGQRVETRRNLSKRYLYFNNPENSQHYNHKLIHLVIAFIKYADVSLIVIDTFKLIFILLRGRDW